LFGSIVELVGRLVISVGRVLVAQPPEQVSDQRLAEAQRLQLAQGAEQPLVLCDENYSADLELEARSEDDILSWML